jgi:uncharacterized repeat protein (TIGR01451 family)
MKNGNARRLVTRFHFLILIAVFTITAAVLALPIHSVRSSSLPLGSATQASIAPVPATANLAGFLKASDSTIVAPWTSSTFRSPLPMPTPTPTPETITTYASNCTTPKTSFVLGETVCAQTVFVTETNRFVNWCVACPTIAYGGAGVTDITTDLPQNFLYTPVVTGTWKATIADSLDSSIVPAVFTVVSVNQTAAIATYAADCVTPKTVFNLGDVVCAIATGVSPALGRRFAWTDPAGFIRTFTPITTDPQADPFNLPGSNTTIIGNFVVDNRGTWKASVVSSRGSLLFSAPFTVKGATPTANLSVAKGTSNSSVNSGELVTFVLSITNSGPSDATNVVLTDPTPANAAFSSVTPSGGFTCAGGVLPCSAPVLAAGATANFQIVYTAGSAGSTITNIATVSSPDAVGANPTFVDPDSSDDSATTTLRIGSGDGTPTDCVIECPNNIVVTTNTTGAIVDFGPEGFGTCGALTSTPASHSFFPVGTTQVTTTSATGNGSCSFTVTVINTPAPTITCAATQTAVTGTGQGDAVVAVNPPIASSGTNVTILGTRSDNQTLSDPYPIGTTTIIWTATECLDFPVCADPLARSASCKQKIIVTSVDFPTITCPLSENKTFTTASCAYTPVAGDIVTPAATGPGVTVVGVRSDSLLLTDPFPAGQTFITWTATNNLGSASCTQIITVTTTGDSTPPELTIPPNISVTTDSCSAVLDDELGIASATDNCTPAVKITRTGVPLIPVAQCTDFLLCPIACPTDADPERRCVESFIFPTGTTTITYDAVDAAGNHTIKYQLVTVTETPAVPPTFTFVPGSLTVPTLPNATICGTFVGDATLGTATATDNCSVTVTRSGVPAGNIFPVGPPTDITYTATDGSGNTAVAHQFVTVEDKTPPTVTAPGPVTLYTGPGATSCDFTVTNLDSTLGTGSATDNCSGVGAVTRSGVPAGNKFPFGPTTLTYSATDAHGNTGSATQVVTVVDNTPPVITLNGQTPSMWPPNHKYQTFGVTNFVTGVNDNCDGPISVGSVVITKVTSDEIENGNGDGNTLNDIVIAADCKSVQLRSEREGNGNGRVYTIYFSVQDSHGNVGTATAKVVVRHNPGETAIDSGVHYTVCCHGTCP